MISSRCLQVRDWYNSLENQVEIRAFHSWWEASLIERHLQKMKRYWETVWIIRSVLGPFFFPQCMVGWVGTLGCSCQSFNVMDRAWSLYTQAFHPDAFVSYTCLLTLDVIRSCPRPWLIHVSSLRPLHDDLFMTTFSWRPLHDDLFMNGQFLCPLARTPPKINSDSTALVGEKSGA